MQPLAYREHVNTLALSPQVLAILDVFATDPRRRTIAQIAVSAQLPPAMTQWLCIRLADYRVLRSTGPDGLALFWPSMKGRRVIADRHRLAALCPLL